MYLIMNNFIIPHTPLITILLCHAVSSLLHIPVELTTHVKIFSIVLRRTFCPQAPNSTLIIQKLLPLANLYEHFVSCCNWEMLAFYQQAERDVGTTSPICLKP